MNDMSRWGQVRKSCISPTVMQWQWKWKKAHNTLTKQLEENVKSSLVSSRHTSVVCKSYCQKSVHCSFLEHVVDVRGPGLSSNCTHTNPQGNSVQNSSSARKAALPDDLCFLLLSQTELAPSRLGRSPAPTAGRFPARDISLEAVL